MKKRYKPVIRGDWKLLFKPSQTGNYINDHTIIKANDGKWHLFGITSFTGRPIEEQYFAHGVSDHLITEGGMTEQQAVIQGDGRAWAPCVIEREGLYYMYYGPSPTKCAESFELGHWMGAPVNLMDAPPLSAHRDHMVIKLEDGSFVMYVVGVHNKYGCVSSFVSKDLKNWIFSGYALTASGNAPLHCGWGAFESPYVVKYEGLYYLFITYTDSCYHPETYEDTLVFCSEDPLHFGDYNGDNHKDIVLAELKEHAGEVIFDEESSKWYVTACGWNGRGIPIEGAASIAELSWEEIKE